MVATFYFLVHPFNNKTSKLNEFKLEYHFKLIFLKTFLKFIIYLFFSLL
jgi:hypothetical protein